MNAILNEALNNYEVQCPKVEFIRHNENETYKVKDELTNAQYVVRIHKPSEKFSLDVFGDEKHSVSLLESEMKLINSIRENTDILVQQPIKNKEGSFVTVLNDGTPVTLLSWIEGSTVQESKINEEVLFTIGKMVGKFHRFSKKYSKDSNLDRYSYDKSLLVNTILKIKTGVELNILSSEQLKVVVDAANEIANRMNELELIENSKGIVHSDLAKSNLILHEGQVAPIDFCLCGNSYYYMDLGSLFSHFDNLEQRKSILSGYKSIIDEEIDTKYIEAFMVFQIILFIATHINNGENLEWFSAAIERWSKEFFIPLANNISFIEL
ncbi:phosphotransferase enzyme family protein [Inconstantimicrobium mannanitabidum]|uniref:Uncharacterized protein n=1 Tax=Inconstantimicrobium mannanitabidum TaxID=1604901 RepID=A0ACB5RAI1_9CLOT|nr:phosphotransferase [Clostridium sp. TW13]GKX66209.1 hypothetical protein rsdtw13_14670 [Clostridium sp. TW13]